LEFQLSDIKEPDSIAPLQTLAVHGKVLYIDDKTFENKGLLEKLVPVSQYSMADQPVEDDEYSSESRSREHPKDTDRHETPSGQEHGAVSKPQGKGGDTKHA
jgi:hypothetical protein